MKKYLIVFSLLVLCKLSSAQALMGFNLHGFVPVGELKRDSPDIWGGGVGLEFAHNIKQSPFWAGAILDATRYGSSLRSGDHGGNLGDVRFRRNNEMLRFVPYLRVQPENKSKILPHGDFYAGISYIFTRSVIRDQDLELIESFSDVNSTVFTFGFGGGVEFLLNDFLSLDLNLRYLRTTRARYLTPQAVEFNTTDFVYELDFQESRFNSLTFGIGVKVLIDTFN